MLVRDFPKRRIGLSYVTMFISCCDLEVFVKVFSKIVKLLHIHRLVSSLPSVGIDLKELGVRCRNVWSLPRDWNL